MQIFLKTKLVRIIKAHLLDVVLGLYDIHKQSYSVNAIKDNWPITGWLLNKKFQFFTKWVLHISANILSEFKYDRSNTKADFTKNMLIWKCNAPGGCSASGGGLFYLYKSRYRIKFKSNDFYQWDFSDTLHHISKNKIYFWKRQFPFKSLAFLFALLPTQRLSISRIFGQIWQ